MVGRYRPEPGPFGAQRAEFEPATPGKEAGLLVVAADDINNMPLNGAAGTLVLGADLRSTPFQLPASHASGRGRWSMWTSTILATTSPAPVSGSLAASPSGVSKVRCRHLVRRIRYRCPRPGRGSRSSATWASTPGGWGTRLNAMRA